MPKTTQLELPLIMPAQAQKHVSVNEAFNRLDAATQLSVLGEESVEPTAAEDGERYIVAEAASGAWSNASGKIAVRSNGGWFFLTPRAGWRAWDASLGAERVHNGVEWLVSPIAVSTCGAATHMRVIEFDHTILPGAENVSTIHIPAKSQVVGVTARVLSKIEGQGVTGWRVGMAGSNDRFGNGLGLQPGVELLGINSVPSACYTESPLVISAEGGSFSQGVIRFCIHVITVTAPRVA